MLIRAKCDSSIQCSHRPMQICMYNPLKCDFMFCHLVFLNPAWDQKSQDAEEEITESSIAHGKFKFTSEASEKKKNGSLINSSHVKSKRWNCSISLTSYMWKTIF